MTETGSSPFASRWSRALPVLLFILALAIRLPGLGWGLKNDLHNQSYHPDETVIWAYSQKIEPTSLDFTPGFYNYGTLYLTLLRVASDVTAAYTGAADPRNADSVWSFVSRVHTAGRLLSALAGAGTVLVVFLMLRRKTNDFGAALGALLIAVAPGHVIHSRFQTVDILATFFLALSALFALRLLDREETENGLRDALLAGVFAGLSAGTKYTGILALLTLFTVLLVKRRSNLLREGAAGLAAALFVFILVTPGAILESDIFLRDFRFEMTHTSTGHGLVFTGVGTGFIYHLLNLNEGMGLLSALLGFGGLAYFAYRKAPWAWALLAFLVPYYLLIGRAEVLFLRYTFPLYIGLAAGFGVLAGQAHRRKGGQSIAVVVISIISLMGLIGQGGLRGTLLSTIWMTGEDPRDQAARELRGAATEGTTIGLAMDPWFWSVPLFPESTTMRSPLFPNRIQVVQNTSKPPVVLATVNESLPAFNPALPAELKPEYIAISSLEYDPYEKLVGRSDLSAEAQEEGRKYSDFMKALAENYTFHRRYGAQTRLAEDIQYVHPVVIVWKRKDASAK